MPTLASNPSVASGATPEGPLVLIVEDDEDTRFLYAESLVHLGYRAAGEATPAAASRRPFDSAPTRS